MKFEVKNIKWIIIGMIAIILSGGIGVYAGTEYFANDIKYSKEGVAETNVKDALDKLYSKIPKGAENITANGTYNIAKKESVNVNVTVA